MTSAESSMAIGDKGVFAALEGRLLVGPVSRVRHFLEAEEGTLLCGAPLPQSKLRHVFSCLGSGTASGPVVVAASSPADAQSAAADKTAAASSSADKTSAAGESPAPAVPTTEAFQAARRKTADFMARMAQYRLGASSGGPGPSSSSSSLSAGRRTNAALGGASAFADPQSEEYNAIKALAASAAADTGDGFMECTFASERLDVGAFAECVASLRAALERDPAAVVFVFSNEGRNRAATLALLYLVQVEAVPLAEGLRRLPQALPRVDYILQLRDYAAERNGDESLATDAYFSAYFARRYPRLELRTIESALASCGRDYRAADRFLNSQSVFRQSAQKTDDMLRRTHTHTYGGGSTTLGSATAASDQASNAGASEAAGAATGTGTDAGGGGSAAVGAARASRGSQDGGTTASSSAAPVLTLTRLDEEVIDTLFRGLNAGGVEVGRQEVADSYVLHRRRKDRVLRDILAQRNAGSGGGGGGVADATNLSVRNVERLAQMGVESPLLRECSPAPRDPLLLRRDSLDVGSIASERLDSPRSRLSSSAAL